MILRAIGTLTLACLAASPCLSAPNESPKAPGPGGGTLAPEPAERSYLLPPFENLSDNRGLYWVGEALSEAIERSLDWAGVPHASREERLLIERELGIGPPTVSSIATRLKEAEELDLTRVVLGSFTVGGDGITAIFRVLDVENARRGAARSIGPFPLASLAALQEALTAALFETEFIIRPESGPQPLQPADEATPAAYEARSKALLEESPEKRILLLERAVEADPAYLRGRLELAQELEYAGEARRALSRLTETRLSGDPQLMFLAEQRAGALFLQAGEPTPAIDALRRSLRWGDDARTHILLARALIARGDYPVAEAELQLAARLDPEDPGIDETRALLASRSGGSGAGTIEPPPSQ